jgi:SNF2 family DNA or RNA helicase
VTVYRLIAEGTVEQKMLSLHQDKRAMVDALLAGTEAAAKLSPADILGLLRA